MFERIWARIVDDAVAEIKTVESHMPHPFGDATTDRIVDVTGVPVAVGYVADRMGNVSPPRAEAQPLEPVPHDLPTPALHIQHDPAFSHAPKAMFAPSGTSGSGPNTNVTLTSGEMGGDGAVHDGTIKTGTQDVQDEQGTTDGRVPAKVADAGPQDATEENRVTDARILGEPADQSGPTKTPDEGGSKAA